MQTARAWTTTVFALIALNALIATASAEPKAAEKYESLLMADDLGEVAYQDARQKILTLSKPEMLELISLSKTWLEASELLRRRTTRTFDVLRRHRDYDKASATAMLKLLTEAKPSRSLSINSLDVVTEKRLSIFLLAKAGQLNSKRIDNELKFISDEKMDSVERLGVAGALVDAMGATASGEVKPTVAQLEKLLSNDISDIRILAVDWFRLSPPSETNERIRFLATALKTNPRQVAERAVRACDNDISPVVREACAKSKAKSDTP